MTLEERSLARDILDLQEGRGTVPVLDEAGAVALLVAARRISIIGASPDRSRPSHAVMRYLAMRGYECVPVNPTCREVMGINTFRTLEEAVQETGPFDIVDVFRRPEHAASVARSAVSTGCRAIWLQLGVVSWAAARIARDGGLAVVMDRCTAIDARRIPAR